ncbi:hypothetical protein MCOR25_010264 [Pyricularia grisea]|nr:hypothetical protein MCOR25_010264 [Pyricularia grisea]
MAVLARHMKWSGVLAVVFKPIAIGIYPVFYEDTDDRLIASVTSLMQSIGFVSFSLI